MGTLNPTIPYHTWWYEGNVPLSCCNSGILVLLFVACVYSENCVKTSGIVYLRTSNRFLKYCNAMLSLQSHKCAHHLANVISKLAWCNSWCDVCFHFLMLTVSRQCECYFCRCKKQVLNIYTFSIWMYCLAVCTANIWCMAAGHSIYKHLSWTNNVQYQGDHLTGNPGNLENVRKLIKSQKRNSGKNLFRKTVYC